MVLNLGDEELLFSRTDGPDGVLRNPARAATVIVAKDGSGDTDDIQEAIEMLPSGGGVIAIKEGTYTVAATININKSNVALIGAGRATKIITTATINLLDINSGVDYVDIDYIYFAGTGGAADTEKANIILSNSDHCRITNCWLEDAATYGITLTGTQNIVTGCYCKNNGWHGITTGSAGDKNIIDKNIFESNGFDGIRIGGQSNNNIISNNRCDSNGSDGIEVNAGDNNILIGNRCISNTGQGINIVNSTTDKTIIMGNHCAGNTGGGIADAGTNTHPNGASGTNNLALDDLNIIA